MELATVHPIRTFKINPTIYVVIEQGSISRFEVSVLYVKLILLLYIYFLERKFMLNHHCLSIKNVENQPRHLDRHVYGGILV